MLFECNDIEVGDDATAVKSGGCRVNSPSQVGGAHLLGKNLGHGTEGIVIQHSYISLRRSQLRRHHQEHHPHLQLPLLSYL